MDDQLEFDDIALLHAFAQVPQRVEDRVQNMVEGLRSVLENADVGVGSIRTQRFLFHRHRRHMLIQSLADPRYPLLFVGIQLSRPPTFRLMIEMSPKYEHRRVIYGLLEQHLPAFSAYGTNWVLKPWDSSSYQLLIAQTPLEKLLNKDDQLGWLTEYTQNSLNALKQSGLIDDIRRVVQQG